MIFPDRLSFKQLKLSALHLLTYSLAEPYFKRLSYQLIFCSHILIKLLFCFSKAI